MVFEDEVIKSFPEMSGHTSIGNFGPNEQLRERPCSVIHLELLMGPRMMECNRPLYPPSMSTFPALLSLV
jgi:hypothetical protein